MSSELTPEDFQLLDRLKRDNVLGGARPVVESDFEQCFRLSELGLIALEQVARGVRLHITRLGVRTLDAALIQPAPAETECPECGRHVQADPQPASGFIARCGRRLTRIEECRPGSCPTPAETWGGRQVFTYEHSPSGAGNYVTTISNDPPPPNLWCRIKKFTPAGRSTLETSNDL